MNIQKILHEADPLIVDVREPFEFAMGHVEGATNVPLGQIPAHIDEYRDLGKPIVFYCRSGRRTLQALEFAQTRGRPDVKAHFGGSMLAWTAAGEPVRTP